MDPETAQAGDKRKRPLPTTINIDDTVPLICAPQGDAVLVVGADMSRIRVSTAVLSTHSPVFRIMFDGRFAEGKQLSSTNPPDIMLPDDDALLMRLLCTILHGLDWAPSTTTAADDTYLNLALLANKYDCCEAKPFKSAFAMWLLHFRFFSADLNAVAQVCLASYILGDRAGFRKDSLKLAKHVESEQELVPLLPSLAALGLPASIAVHLCGLRKKLFDDFFRTALDRAVDAGLAIWGRRFDHGRFQFESTETRERLVGLREAPGSWAAGVDPLFAEIEDLGWVDFAADNAWHHNAARHHLADWSVSSCRALEQSLAHINAGYGLCRDCIATDAVSAGDYGHAAGYCPVEEEDEEDEEEE